MTTLTAAEGLITKIIGPVVDVEFPDGNLPNIYTALNMYNDDGTKVVAEVQQMLGSNKVRTVAMSSTDGLRRGMKVVNTNEPIKIPVGNAILGRILNVVGDAVDNGGEIQTDTYLPIHRESPKLVDQNTDIEILETGILRRMLKKAMWQNAGIVRTKDGLNNALRVIEDIKLISKHSRVYSTQEGYELRNSIIAAQLITEAALSRENSIGAHFREDAQELPKNISDIKTASMLRM